VVLCVAAHAAAFVGGTWLALAARGGDRDPTYLLAAPLLLLHFTVFFSFSLMLAVLTRNAAACAFGAVLFWLLCWAMNFGRHAAVNALDLPGAGWALEVGYWVLPKPLDFQIALTPSLGRDPALEQLVDVRRLTDRGLWAPAWSLLASAAWGLALLAVAAYDFGTVEY
jgi:hypothetical protein